MLLSNTLPKHEKTDWCNGRPMQHLGIPCHVISYTSSHVRNELFEITSALLAFQGKSETIRGKEIIHASMLQIGKSEVEDLTINIT